MKPTKSKSKPATTPVSKSKPPAKTAADKTKLKTPPSAGAPSSADAAGQSQTPQGKAIEKPSAVAKIPPSPEKISPQPSSASEPKPPLPKATAPKKTSAPRKAAKAGSDAPSQTKGLADTQKAPLAKKEKQAKSSPSKPPEPSSAKLILAPPSASLPSIISETKDLSASKSEPSGRVSQVRHKEPKPALPSILFEEDPPAPAAPAAAPEQSAPKNPNSAPPPVPVDPAPAPEEPSKLSGKLLLAAQNPNTLFVYCDVTGSSLEQARVKASANKLHIRIYRHGKQPARFEESELPLGTHGVLVPVSESGTDYTAELGYYTKSHEPDWVSLLTSETASTPELKIDPLVAEDARFGDVLYLVQSAIEKQVPVVEVVQHLHLTGQLREEELVKLAQEPWPAEYAEIFRELSHSARHWTRPSSQEFLKPLPAPKQSAEIGPDSGFRKQYPTSPKPSKSAARDQSIKAGGKGFWFNVNVEIVVYGATEPDAKVIVGGRRIKLSPDGSFSMRYALPDGAYGMDIGATSASESDSRKVHLHFSRATARDGDIGQHAQDPKLFPPG